MDEVRSIYPATEAERVGEPGGGRKGRVVWGMDLKNKRLCELFSGGGRAELIEWAQWLILGRARIRGGGASC